MDLQYSAPFIAMIIKPQGPSSASVSVCAQRASQVGRGRDHLVRLAQPRDGAKPRGRANGKKAAARPDPAANPHRWAVVGGASPMYESRRLTNATAAAAGASSLTATASCCASRRAHVRQ